MGIIDNRVDAYIKQSAAFAVPVLNKLRSLVHEACPEVKETIKWSFPNFEYKGRILCNMAAFKQHCSFGFWLSSQMEDPENILSVTDRTGMGNLGQLKSIDDLPKDKIFKAYVKQAMKLVDEGAKLEKTRQPVNNLPLKIPSYFKDALQANTAANNYFNSLSKSKKGEYVEWMEEAKTEATRNKRMQTAIEWLAEGKSRNWKYEKK